MWQSLLLLAASEVSGLFRRTVRAALCYGVAIMSVLFGVGFALVALRNWLALAYPEINADLLIAAAMAVIAGMAYAGGVALQHYRQRRETLRAASLIAAPVIAGAVRKMPLASAALILVAAVGLFAGRAIANGK